MKKVLLLIVVMIFLIGLIESETFKQSSLIDFKKTCTNSSGAVCSTTASCNMTIKYPANNSYSVNNKLMTNNKNGFFNYTLQPNNVDVLGIYNWDMFCKDSSDSGEAHGSFMITTNGNEITSDKAIIYLGMLSLLLILFIFSIGSIILLPSDNNKDEDNFFISVNSLKYLRPVMFAVAWGMLLAILFISSNISLLFLESGMMGNLLFSLFSILMWLTIPITFLCVLFIFVNIFRDVEMKKMIERGVQLS